MLGVQRKQLLFELCNLGEFDGDSARHGTSLDLLGLDGEVVAQPGAFGEQSLLERLGAKVFHKMPPCVDLGEDRARRRSQPSGIPRYQIRAFADT